MGRVGDLTSPEALAAADDGAVLVIPLGSTEQHGPHLPLSTDTDIALGIAERVAAERAGTVIAPPLPYGSSGEHQAFAGTLSIGPEATVTVLVELVRSASATFRSIVLLSAHGGNAEAVSRAAAQLRAEGRPVLVWSPRWDGDAHAGHVETSVMLALRAEQVRLGRAEAGNVGSLAELLPALRADRFAVVAPNGVLGDPTTASADEGRRLLGAAANDLAAAIDRWAESA